MSRVAIISVDGHVKASRADYRPYIQKKYSTAYDEEVKALEAAGVPDAGNMNPSIGIDVQWDSKLRAEKLESIGVVAEVLFPNGVPFQANRLDDFARGADRDLEREGRQAYNRWLADFCAEMPERRKGQMVMDFSDVAEAVRDVYWAKENGLGGISLPGMNPGDTFYFDPTLDPIWGAIEEVGLPSTQHGGAGLPAYHPPGFALIMMVVAENGFFSNRSLWMMITAGVFDRFPGLRVSYIETQVHILKAILEYLDDHLDPKNDWMGFAKMMGRERIFERQPSEYFGTNVFVGLSPFSPRQMPINDLIGKDEHQTALPGFHIGVDATMYGVDYPHYESIFDRNAGEVATLLTYPGVTEQDAEKILFSNATRALDFDLDALQPHIDRVGFELSDVRERAVELMAAMPEQDTPFKNDSTNSLTSMVQSDG
jgi:predicted TIM-barrel fold metal-dependent hydrolase